jgi:hypothetical protein
MRKTKMEDDMRSTRVMGLVVLVVTVATVGILGFRKGSLPTGNMTPTNAKQWAPLLSGLAVSPTGTPWAVGQIYKKFNFGSGDVAVSGAGDIYLVKLDPATGLATAAFTFGDLGSKGQVAGGVAVASSGNVGVIGTFTGEIDFTASNSNGSGLSDKSGTAGLDYLVGGSKSPFFGVFDGASKGSYVIPKKAHVVDLGTGALMAVSSNPSQNAIAICGKTSNAVSNWSDSGSNKGVITGGDAIAGGGMDIVVAKIDAASGAVIWGKQFGGAGDQICESVTIDNNGDVIIAGVYTGTLNFGSEGTALPVRADPSLALLYIAKLQGTTGAAVAARTWGSGGRSNAYSATVDATSHIIVAGRLGGDIDFGGGVSISSRGLTDAFVVRLTTALQPVWAKSFGNADFDSAVKSVSASSVGDVFIAGSFQGRLDTLGLTSASNTAVDAFVAKLAVAEGAVRVAHAYGDARGAQSVNSIAVARAATGALADSMFMGGSFSSGITLGSTTLSTDSPNLSASYIARVIP